MGEIYIPTMKDYTDSSIRSEVRQNTVGYREEHACSEGDSGFDSNASILRIFGGLLK